MGLRKVIHVITRLDRGGSAENTLLTAIGHDRRRFHPMVLAGDPGRWDDQGGATATELNRHRLKGAGVSVQVIQALTRGLNPAKDLLALRKLVQIFRREQPDIVHTHTSKAGALGRVAARIAGVPALVHTPHGHVFYGHFGPLLSWSFLRTEQVLARYTARLIALTASERDDHVTRGVGQPEQFAVIPSGIHLDRFRALVGSQWGRPQGCDWPVDAIVIGSVGWLTPVKGHRYLIEAFAKLKPSFPRLHLFIVGSGGLRADYQALVARLGITDAVTLAGDRTDIDACLASMSVFVLPSLNEGMGRALVEAMAAGRPVIATRVGGVPALIQDCRNGMLVPPGDVTALTRALSQILSRPDWAKELGEEASISIDKRFDADEMVRMVEAVYDEVPAHAERS